MSIDNVIDSIPSLDLTRLFSSYKTLPHEGLPESPSSFMSIVLQRINYNITEEMGKSTTTRIMQKLIEERRINRVINSSLPSEIILQLGFKEYIDEQTHCYIRDVLKHEERGGIFFGMSDAEYQTHRGVIIHAFVKHAINFLQEEHKGDKIDLRQPLAYIYNTEK